ncbi:MAG TPA: hypothetical protein IAC41_06655 [Candidatus Merdenecus merdavium]|nr:hypothetical protein [Candidatus Merdenecus merdavium]
MSIHSIQAIKEAEEAAELAIVAAKEKAQTLIKDDKAKSDHMYQKKIDESKQKRREILEAAEEKAAKKCLILEQENEDNKKAYEFPDQEQINRAIKQIKMRVLKHVD